MYTSHSPSWDAKNRHDLKPELPFEYINIAYCIPNHEDKKANENKIKYTKKQPKSLVVFFVIFLFEISIKK